MEEERGRSMLNNKNLFLFLLLFYFYFYLLSGFVAGFNLGWNNLGAQTPGLREESIMGAFYQPPAFQGSVGKRILVLYGGDQGNNVFSDVWFYDVGN